MYKLYLLYNIIRVQRFYAEKDENRVKYLTRNLKLECL